MMLSRTDVDALLAAYEAMAEAAQANDWPRLAAIEAQAAGVRNAAMKRASAQGEAAGTQLSDELQQAFARDIERILALDAEIRSHSTPFLDSVRKLLSSQSRERAVRNAYGAKAP